MRISWFDVSGSPGAFKMSSPSATMGSSHLSFSLEDQRCDLQTVPGGTLMWSQASRKRFESRPKVEESL